MVSTLYVQGNGQRNDKQGQHSPSSLFHKCVCKSGLSSGRGIFGVVRGKFLSPSPTDPVFAESGMWDLVSRKHKKPFTLKQSI